MSTEISRKNRVPTVVSVTPAALSADSRTLKMAVSLARAGYKSIVLEGLASTDQFDDLGIEVITLRLDSGATSAAPPEEHFVASTEPAAQSLRIRLKEAVKRSVIATYLNRVMYAWKLFRKNGLDIVGQIPKADAYLLHSFTFAPAVLVKSRFGLVPIHYDAHDLYRDLLDNSTTDDFSINVASPVYSFYEKLAVIFSRHRTAASRRMALVLEKGYSRRFEYLRNLHDDEIKSESRGSTIRERLDLPDNSLLLVSIGNAKGGHTFGPLAKALHQGGGRFHLAVVGTFDDKVRKEFESAGSGEYIHFLGQVPCRQLVEIVADADGAVFPYIPKYDAYSVFLPNGFGQAVAAGLPILFPSGIPEIAEPARHGNVGWEFDPNDAASASSALLQFGDDVQRRKAAERSRCFFSEFSWCTEENRFLAFYRYLFAEHVFLEESNSKPVGDLGADNQARPMSVLLVCDYYQTVAETLHDHIDSILNYSVHNVQRISFAGSFPEGLDLDKFDALFFHYSIVISRHDFLSPSACERIQQFEGLKCVFVQDEYRFVDSTVEAIGRLGIDVLFTCIPDEEIEAVYPQSKLPGVQIVNVLTGYVPDRLPLSFFKRAKPSHARQIDVGYRARKVPAWLGQLGQEKWLIGKRFKRDAENYSLRTDISFLEEDRLYGKAWVNFLRNCKAVLGTESGASVIDFTGEVQRQVDERLQTEPGLSFEELSVEYFSHLEGQIDMAQISPRCFECASLGTVMILYEGRYSNKLKPWRHFIPLRKDHGNMKEVVEAVSDPLRIKEISTNAYHEVALSYDNSYRYLVAKIDRVLAASLTTEKRSCPPFYSNLALRRLELANHKAVRFWISRFFKVRLNLLVYGRLLSWLSAEDRIRIQQRVRRFYLWGARVKRAIVR